VGCGICAPICPEKNIRLVDLVREGIRPQIIDTSRCGSCHECLDVCPSQAVDYQEHNTRANILPELLPAFGPVLEVWEGHAVDPEIRFRGSSGGALTALALYCLENENMSGVLHIGENPDDPVRNQTLYSRTRAELIAHAGSRYAPASTCDHIEWIENAESLSVFIGQPSEVTALRKAQNMRPALARKVGLTLSFFCAGSPSTQGTIELLRKLGISGEKLSTLRYRGYGWPGMFTTSIDDASPHEHLTYQESWAFLQSFRPYTTHLQPDGSGEDADVSCGDPWYRTGAKDEIGSSLVVVRSELGRRIVRSAMQAGYLQLVPAEPWKLAKSQENLTNKRCTIWGRRFAFKLAGLPLTHISGLPLFRLWLGLSLRGKLRSIFGTLQRILQRKYYLPLRSNENPSSQ
jgi:coenzyme F420 hydrogenase subunit beta